MKQWRILFFYLGTLLFFGCSILPTPMEIPAFASTQLTDIAQELKRREQQLQTVQGVCQLNMESAEKRGNFSGVLLVQRPDRFRLVGYRSLIGSTTILDILLEGAQLSLYLPSENKVFRGSSTQSRFLNGNEMMTSFFGFENRTFLLLEETETVYLFALLTPERKFQQTLKVQKKSLMIQEQTFYDANGNVNLYIQYRNYQKIGELYWPYEVDIVQFQPSHTLRIRFKEVELNVVLQPEAFLQEIPEDAIQESAEVSK